MKSPVDVKAVMDAVSATEEARSKSIRVHLYLDPTAPDDLVNMVAAAFKTTAANATVLVEDYPMDGRMPDALADIAVLVAGMSEDTGMLAADLRSLNTPSLVVTSLPSTVKYLAKESKYPLLEEDIVSPVRDEEDSDADTTAKLTEPIALSAGDAERMRDEMGSWIVEVFEDTRLAFANAFPFVRRPLSLESVRATSVQNAGIGLVVILPGADMPIMTLNQLKMLLQIAAAYNQPLSLARAKEMLAVVGGAFGCRALARQLAGLFPGIGWAIKAGIGYGGTAAMGRALIEYFEADGDMAQLAGKAADATQSIAPSLGVSPDASVQENLQNAAQSLCGKAEDALQDAARKVAPFAGSVLKAAAEATGITPQDVANFGKSVVSAVGSNAVKTN